MTALSRACFALSVGALIEGSNMKNFGFESQFLSSKFYSKISTIQSRFLLCVSEWVKLSTVTNVGVIILDS